MSARSWSDLFFLFGWTNLAVSTGITVYYPAIYTKIYIYIWEHGCNSNMLTIDPYHSEDIGFHLSNGQTCPLVV